MLGHWDAKSQSYTASSETNRAETQGWGSDRNWLWASHRSVLLHLALRPGRCGARKAADTTNNYHVLISQRNVPPGSI